MDFPICSWPVGRDSSLRPSYITNVSVRYGVLDSIMRAQLVNLSPTLIVGLTIRRGYNIGPIPNKATLGGLIPKKAT